MIDSTVCDIKPADLPAPPQAALQVMRACARENINNEELSRLAESDPVLSAELLRIVNSPLFGFAGNIKSIVRAISVLGLSALRNIALCIAVRDTLKKDAIPGLDLKLFWEDALRLAVCARTLGEAVDLDSDECFTAGLLQDFGLLVLFFLQPDKASVWPKLRSLTPEARYAMEHQVFNATHEQITSVLAAAWSLPESLARALGSHHVERKKAKGAEDSVLGTVLHCADWLAAVFSSEDKAAALMKSRELVKENFDIAGQQVEEMFSAVPKKVEEAAGALGLRIKQQEDFEAILKKANLLLADDNRSYQELTWLLSKALKERDQLAEELNRELMMAREIQQSLLPGNKGPDFPIHAVNLSARQLSGDFYDFFTLPDGRIYFCLGDVSGKGTNAALLMAKTCSLFRALGKQLPDPKRLLAQINNEICETSVRGMFVTLAGGLYDPATGKVILVNAGHPPVLIVRRDGKTRALEAQAPPLGVIPGINFPETAIKLGANSLYAYSDGLIECRCVTGKVLGIRGLVSSIKQVVSLDPQKRLEALISGFKRPSLPLHDDVTLLLLEARNAAG